MSGCPGPGRAFTRHDRRAREAGSEASGIAALGIPAWGVPTRIVAVGDRGATAPAEHDHEILPDYLPDADPPPRARAGGVAPDAAGGARVRCFRDASRHVLARSVGPDPAADLCLDPYRGCEHACVYCAARPTHAFLGFSAQEGFDTRLLVKSDAPALLQAELDRPRYRPQAIALGDLSDPYQPVERRFQLTRQCLQVLLAYRNPAHVTTRSQLVLRDLDVLRGLASEDAVAVAVAIPTLNARLGRALEPHASSPAQRLRAIHCLAEAGVPVGVLVAPVVPGLTDDEIPTILEAAATAGAGWARHALLRLPHPVDDLFSDWLQREVPVRKAQVLQRVEALGAAARCGGRGERVGAYGQQLGDLFRRGTRRHGLGRERPALSPARFRPPLAGQMSLF